MADLLPWPFALPARFLDQLGYRRTVEAFDSPAMRARLAELLRRQGIDAGAAPPTGPRRFVALYWEPAGDELAFSDGVHSGAGQLNHWLWLDYLHGRTPRYAAAGARSHRRLAGRAPGRTGLERRPRHARLGRRRRLGISVGRADRARPPHRPRAIARPGGAALTTINDGNQSGGMFHLAHRWGRGPNGQARKGVGGKPRGVSLRARARDEPCRGT